MASTTTATAMQRADKLLRQMTLEEKAMQLSSVVPLALLGTGGPIRGQLELGLEHVVHGALAALSPYGSSSRWRWIILRPDAVADALGHVVVQCDWNRPR
jgi:hypothetical protein